MRTDLVVGLAGNAVEIDMTHRACARVLAVAGWGMVALSAICYAGSAFDSDVGRAEVATGAAAALALLGYWQLAVRPRLTQRNGNSLMPPLVVAAFASLVVNLACSSLVAVWVCELAAGLATVSSDWLVAGRAGERAMGKSLAVDHRASCRQGLNRRDQKRAESFIRHRYPAVWDGSRNVGSPSPLHYLLRKWSTFIGDVELGYRFTLFD